MKLCATVCNRNNGRADCFRILTELMLVPNDKVKQIRRDKCIK